MTSTQIKIGLIAIAIGLVAALSFALGRRTGFREGRASLPVVRASLHADRSVEDVLHADRSVEDVERVDVCLHTQTPTSPAHEVNGQIDRTIQGTVVGSGAAASVPPLPGHDLFCEVEPQWYLDVKDAQDVLWRLLYSVTGIVVEGPAVKAGTRVTVRLRAHWGFAKAAGVIVSDEAGPVFVAEQGAFGHGLEPEDLAPLRVRVSEVFGVRHEGCGDAVLHSVEVEGDATTRVLPGRVGTLGLRGTRYQFWNAASYNWINVSCTDMLDTVSWFLWRS